MSQIVAWAVRDPGGWTYVPWTYPGKDDYRNVGTRDHAQAVADRNQGRGGFWSVVPLVAADVSGSPAAAQEDR